MLTKEEHHTTNFGIDVAPATHRTATVRRVTPAHVDEHAREEMLTGHHPDHGTNFGLILPTEVAEDEG